MPVAALLLAAGESSRMGRPKALLPWGNGSLLQHQVSELVTAVAAPVLVVLGPRAEALLSQIQPPARWVINPDPARGKCSSVLVGLAELGQEWQTLLVLAVDQPSTASMLRRLVERHLASDARLTLPCHGGRLGHPPVFSRALLPQLMSIAEHTRGLREVVRRHAAEAALVEFDSKEPLLDLNDPSDYEAARQLTLARSDTGY